MFAERGVALTYACAYFRTTPHPILIRCFATPSPPCVLLLQEVPDVPDGPANGAFTTGLTQPADGEADAVSDAADPEPQQTALTQTAFAALKAAAAALAAGLNEEQRLAVRRVMGSADYSLVLGMPGTGKTSVIVAAVRRLVTVTGHITCRLVWGLCPCIAKWRTFTSAI